MIATVTNLHPTLPINSLQVEDSGADLGTARIYAVGGARNRPLPFPCPVFEVAVGGSIVFPIRPRDLRQREAGIGNAHGTHEAGEVWNQISANGIGYAAIAFGVQAGRSDIEELFIAAV